MNDKLPDGKRTSVAVPRDLLGEVTKATLAAIRCIPDGEHRAGCTVYSGEQVRENLRLAVVALTKAAATSGPDRDPDEDREDTRLEQPNYGR